MFGLTRVAISVGHDVATGTLHSRKGISGVIVIINKP